MENKTIYFEGIHPEEVENGKVEVVSSVGNLYHLHFKEGKPVKLEDIDIITTEWEFQELGGI